jgi:serine/threonine protein phosphatase PrpC
LSLIQITTPHISNDEILAVFKGAHANILEVYENAPAQCTYVAPGYKSLGEYSLKIDKDKRPVYTTPGAKSARPLEFGTTALMCVLFEETKELVVAWVGDSKAILVSKDAHSDDMLVQDLTISHNGRNPDEEARINRDYPGAVAFSSDGYICPRVPGGPTHHLAMTRALGHKALYEYGVIPEPQVRRLRIRDNDFFLLAASDGVWDNLSDGEILDTVLDCSSPIKGVTELVYSVMDVTQMKMVDNTTAVLVHFDIE